MANTTVPTQRKEILTCHTTRARRAPFFTLSYIFNKKKRLQGTVNDINKDGKLMNLTKL